MTETFLLIGLHPAQQKLMPLMEMLDIIAQVPRICRASNGKLNPYGLSSFCPHDPDKSSKNDVNIRCLDTRHYT